MGITAGHRVVGYNRAESFRDNEGLIQAGFRQEGNEFLASVPGEEIDLAESGLSYLSHLSEDLVAYVVTIRIIYCLEAIEIDHQKSETPPVSFYSIQLAFRNLPASLAIARSPSTGSSARISTQPGRPRRPAIAFRQQCIP